MTIKNIQKQSRHTKNPMHASFALLMFIFGILLFSSVALALSPVAKEMMPIIAEPDFYPEYRAPAQNSQYYSVMFDEEGEAVVALKVNLNNPSNETLDKLKIEIPGETIRILNVVQEYHLLKEECAEWKEVCADDNCTSYYKKCSYFNSYVDYSSTKFYPVEYAAEKLSGSTAFTFTLPKVITQQNTATLIIYYKATGYVKKSLGVHNFDFETIKYNYDTSHVRVSINVQNDLFLEGTSASVNYKPADYGMMAEASFAKSESFDSKQLSEYSRSIEYDYGYVKEASALDPWESFHVKGKYSTSKSLLNKGRISLTIGIILGVLVLLFFGARKAYRVLRDYSGISFASNLSNASAGKASKSNSSKSAVVIPNTSQALAMVLTASFISSILLLLGWYALSFISKNLYNWIGYSSSGVLTLLMILIFFLYSLFVLFAPAIYVGIRLGILPGFATFGAVIGFLIIELIILAIIYASMGAGGYYY